MKHNIPIVITVLSDLARKLGIAHATLKKYMLTWEDRPRPVAGTYFLTPQDVKAFVAHLEKEGALKRKGKVGRPKG